MMMTNLTFTTVQITKIADDPPKTETRYRNTWVDTHWPINQTYTRTSAYRRLAYCWSTTGWYR